jgi:hypothetical protein
MLEVCIGQVLSGQWQKKSHFRWVDNIEMDLREIGWDGRDWIYLAQDGNQWRSLVNAVMNLRVP